MRVISKILIVSISLLFASKIALADQNDPRLNNLFEKLNIVKKLDNKLETWNYEKLNEAGRIALEIKQKIN